MSLNVPEVSRAKIMDPRLEINQDRVYGVLKGAMVNNWQSFPATNLNNSSVQVTANPPSRNIAISRFILKEAQFEITINGTNSNPAGKLLQEGFYAPRCMPLLSSTNTEQLGINNANVSQAPLYQYWPALLWYQNEFQQRFGRLSTSTPMLDQFLTYEEGVGTIRNPLAPYGDNSFENTRGGFVGLEVLSNNPGATSATLRLTVTEPCFISPAVFDKNADNVSGLVGVENISYTATFRANLLRVLSLVQDQGAPGVINIDLITSVCNLSGFRLLFNYLTPDPVNPIPRSLVSSYFSLVSYPTRAIQSFSAGETKSIEMQSIQLSSIPRRIYIFARIDDADQTAFTTDTYFALAKNVNPLRVTWNNNQFFSTASTQDLYNVSVKNGLNMSYSQFLKNIGSVVCLEVGTDLGLMPDQAPGSLDKIQFSCSLTVTNNYNYAITPTLYVVCVYEGTFTIIEGNTSTYLGVLSKADVMDARRIPGVSYKKSEEIYGGDFFSSISKYARGAHDFIKQNRLVSKTLGAIPDYRAKIASSIAESAGYGMDPYRVRSSDIRGMQ